MHVKPEPLIALFAARLDNGDPAITVEMHSQLAERLGDDRATALAHLFSESLARAIAESQGPPAGH